MQFSCPLFCCILCCCQNPSARKGKAKLFSMNQKNQYERSCNRFGGNMRTGETIRKQTVNMQQVNFNFHQPKIIYHSARMLIVYTHLAQRYGRCVCKTVRVCVCVPPMSHCVRQISSHHYIHKFIYISKSIALSRLYSFSPLGCLLHRKKIVSSSVFLLFSKNKQQRLLLRIEAANAYLWLVQPVQSCIAFECLQLQMNFFFFFGVNYSAPNFRFLQLMNIR